MRQNYAISVRKVLLVALHKARAVGSTPRRLTTFRLRRVMREVGLAITHPVVPPAEAIDSRSHNER